MKSSATLESTMPVLDRSQLRMLFILIPAIVFWLCTPRGLVADDTTAGFEIGRISVGFGGNFKVGRWTPVRVDVSTTRPLKLRLTVGAADPDGNLTELPGELVDFPQAGSHTLKGLFRSGKIENDLHITVTSESQARDFRIVRVSSHEDGELRPALRHTVPLVATLGKPAGFVEAPEAKSSSKQGSSGSSQPFMKVVELEGIHQLYRSALEFDTLDVLVFAAKYDADEQQSEAIRGWVQSGGHLVLSVGAELAAYRKSRLASWVPIPIIGPSRLRAFHGLETYSGKNVGIKFRGQFRSAPSVRLGPVEGKIAVSELDGPVLVHVPYGFGKITFLALDLDRPPLSTWPSLGVVAEKIITGRQSGPRLQQSGSVGSLAHSGISDLATQIHAAQEHFPGISRFSTWMVMGLLLVYLLIIGPLDYLIVHRLLKKPRLTWITFPLMVVAVGTLAVWGASATNGSQIQMNQLDIVDIDEESALTRTTTWITFYSPQMRRYRVEVDHLPLAASSSAESSSATVSSTVGSQLENRARLSWSGIPEEAFGGMYRSSGLNLARPSYQYATGATALDNLPVATWSTKSLLATWHGSSTETLVTSQLIETGGGYLSGQIVHHLDGTLDDWVLAYGKNVYLPAKGRSAKTTQQLPAGKILQVGRKSRTRVLKDYLSGTRRAVSDEEDGQPLSQEVFIEHEEYDPLNRDLDIIIRMLTFYSGAGGKGYTSLDNNVLRTFDLSGHLKMKRAVLFAKLNRPAAGVKLDGKNVRPTNTATYIRIILPVKRRERNDRFLRESRQQKTNTNTPKTG